MTNITSFPDIEVVVGTTGGVFVPFTAGANIKHGQVVCFAANGVSLTVIPSVNDSGTWPVGVAITDASAGEKVSVCCSGVVRVANADDTATIDAGDWLEANSNTVGGTVSAATLTANGTTCTPHWVVGIALEDIPGGGTGLALICPQQIIQPNAT